MRVDESRPCLVCGDSTHLVLFQDSSPGTTRTVALCRECLSLWPRARSLLVSTRSCWGAETIRKLLQPAQPDAAFASSRGESVRSAASR